MKTLLHRSLTVLTALAVVATAAQSQAKDPSIGTWVLNVAKSSGAAATKPKSGTRTYAASGDKLSLAAEVVGADGKTTKTSFTAAADGKDYAYTGDANADMIAIKRIDANTVEATLKKGGKVVSTATRAVSKDGKTLTISVESKDAKGAPVKSVSVWDKK